jgi:hypothetical protein
MVFLSRAGLCLTVLLLSACASPAPARVVIVVDLTASVDGLAESLEPIVTSTLSRVPRGSTVKVLPITCDGERTIGRSVRFDLQGWREREVRDRDVQRLIASIPARLMHFVDAVGVRHRCSDVAGALRLASDELVNGPAGRSRVLIVLSDFISDSPLADASGSPTFSLPETDAYVGMVSSRDAIGLTPPARAAVRLGARRAIEQSGARVTFREDGPCGLDDFLRALWPGARGARPTSRSAARSTTSAAAAPIGCF